MKKVTKVINHWKDMASKNPRGSMITITDSREFGDLDLSKVNKDTQDFFQKIYYEDYYKGTQTLVS